MRIREIHLQSFFQLMFILPYSDLIFFHAQHYNGDISELELYFVIVNNEYGEQCEEELLPGGREMRVTNDNVITFIHLVANHRLNYQVIDCIYIIYVPWNALLNILDWC
jgi:hypothetical protein